MFTQRDGFHRLFIFVPRFNFGAAIGPTPHASTAASPPAIYDLDPIEHRRDTRIRP
jgi:hypothetical protein